MANEKTEDSLTVRHLVNTLDRIQEWTGYVKTVLESMDQEEVLPIKTHLLVDIRDIRQKGKGCETLVPLWLGAPMDKTSSS